MTLEDAVDNQIFRSVFVAGAILTASGGQQAALSQQEGAFNGKTVEMLIGLSAGGGYDAYGRMLARFIGRHIPGQPQVIARNMPGAGSLVLINHLYSVAPKSGLTFGLFDPVILISPLMGGQNAKFDATKFGWIGSMAGGTSVCVTWHTSPVSSWSDLFKPGLSLPFGTSGPADSRYQHTAILKNMFNANVRIIPGYDGSSAVRLALERGEIAGNCGDSWASLKSTAAEWVRDKKINIVAQYAVEKHPDLAHVPLIMDMAKTETDREALKLLLGPQKAGRPFAAPPGVPVAILTVLKRAFDATMNDPELRELSKKMDLEIEPVSGEDVAAIFDEIYKTSAAGINAAKEAIK